MSATPKLLSETVPGAADVAAALWAVFPPSHNAAPIRMSKPTTLASFTLAKVVGLLILIGAALWLGGNTAHNAAATSAAPGTVSLSSFGVALIPCLLGYDGWVQLPFVAGELRDPKRNILRALVAGTLG